MTVEAIEADRRELELIVATALHSGMGPRTAALLITREHKDPNDHNPNQLKRMPRWPYEVVFQCINRVQAVWQQDFELEINTYRARQVERLQQDIARERARERPSLQGLRGHEELLARITGTLKPVKVEVDVMAVLKASMAAVIVDLSESERDAIVAEQLELEAVVRRRLPPIAAE